MKDGLLNRKVTGRGLLLFLGLGLTFASARANGSTPEFEIFQRRLAELAGKVDLFREIWRVNPGAEISGGAARDFVYWVKGVFAPCKGEVGCLERVHAELMARPQVEARAFLPIGSDLDVVSKMDLSSIDVSRYLLKRIDAIDPNRFDPSTVIGKSEVDQGFIPAEKIRLGQRGVKSGGSIGNGVFEIYTGQLRVHFADRAAFELTHYAKLGINHPFLLAMRYVKLLSMNDRFENPNAPVATLERVLKGSHPEDVKATKAVFLETASDERFLARFANPKFKEYVHDVVLKAFGARTHATATQVLLKAFDAEAVWTLADGSIPPLNHFLYARSSDRAETIRRLKDLGVSYPERLLVDSKAITGGIFYHGTPTEEGFQKIVLHGAYPSDGSRLVGSGLYGVEEKNLSVAVQYAGTLDRVVAIPLSKEAVILDHASPEYAAAAKEFERRGLVKGFDAFCEYVGADGLYYWLGSQRAFAIKNSAVLGKANGHTRQILTYGELRELAKRRPTGLARAKFIASALGLPMNREQFRILLKDAGTSEEVFRYLESISKDLASDGIADEGRTSLEKLAFAYSELLGADPTIEADLAIRARNFQTIAISAIERKMEIGLIGRSLVRPAGISEVGEARALLHILELAKAQTLSKAATLKGYTRSTSLRRAAIFGLIMGGPFAYWSYAAFANGDYVNGAIGAAGVIIVLVANHKIGRTVKQVADELGLLRDHFEGFEKLLEAKLHSGCPQLLAKP